MDGALELGVERHNGTTVVTAAGELDMATAPKLRECLLTTEGNVVVDLRAVSFLDSSGIGVLIAVSWIVALTFGTIWAVVAWTTRYSSASGLAASALTPVLLAFLVGGRSALLFAALTALIWFTHRANIQRLLAGTEPKIGGSKAAEPEA